MIPNAGRKRKYNGILQTEEEIDNEKNKEKELLLEKDN